MKSFNNHSGLRGLPCLAEGICWATGSSLTTPFTEGRLGVNDKASPPGRHQEQAPKQRCTFSSTTFSSVQYVRVSRFMLQVSVQFMISSGSLGIISFLRSLHSKFSSGDTVPIRSWTRTPRRPGIRHRHLPCHAMPFSSNRVCRVVSVMVGTVTRLIQP